ncbi:hypothetical protein [Desulforhopalus sp. 52FAK]
MKSKFSTKKCQVFRCLPPLSHPNPGAGKTGVFPPTLKATTMKNNQIRELTVCMTTTGVVTLIYQATPESGVINVKQADAVPSEWIQVRAWRTVEIQNRLTIINAQISTQDSSASAKPLKFLVIDK